MSVRWRAMLALAEEDDTTGEPEAHAKAHRRKEKPAGRCALRVSV
jgi:hypothetical protein